MTNIRKIIATGDQLTKEQDDEAYALLSPEEYYALSDEQKPPQVNEQIGVVFSFTAQSLHNLQNDWCVYVVNDLFIGCCKLSQVLMIPDVARSISFKHVTPSNVPITVLIIEQFASDVEARLHRNALMGSGRFINVPNTAGSTTEGRHIVRATSDGNTFASVREAATFYGISPSSVYNSLRNVGDIRDLGFERI